MKRPPRFSLELDGRRRRLWQKAADAAIPGRQRNLAPWLVPLVDLLAELELAGKRPGDELRKIVGRAS